MDIIVKNALDFVKKNGFSKLKMAFPALYSGDPRDACEKKIIVIENFYLIFSIFDMIAKNALAFVKKWIFKAIRRDR